MAMYRCSKCGEGVSSSDKHKCDPSLYNVDYPFNVIMTNEDKKALETEGEE
jgi:hypothetical protein